MTKAHEGAVCAVWLFAATSMWAGERFVAVTTPDGSRDATATVACAEPDGPAAVVDASGRAALPDGCRHVRCASDRWLPGAAAPGPTGAVACALRPAAKLAIELPQDADGALVVSVSRHDGTAPVFRTVATSAARKPRPPVAVPPLPPGRYRLSVGRADGSWTCLFAIRLAVPKPVSVFVPWRDALVVDGRVASAEGRPLAGVPVFTATEDSSRGEVEDWRCAAASDTGVRSGADGTFRLSVDPRVATLVVAGGWSDPRGIAFVSRRGPRAGRVALTPAIPHRASARVLDDEDEPVTCRVRLAVADPDERWAARAAPGGPREASCAADGHVEVGPFRADAFQLDLRSDEALPLRVQASIPAGVPFENLGVIRVERGATLRVRVNDDLRAPVTGAEVSAATREGFVMERSAPTGADGVARLQGLPPGASVRVAVEAAGYGREVRDQVATGGEVEIAMTRTGAVQGKVTADGGGAVRARVSATTPDGRPIADTDADEAGSFAFRTLPKGVALLRASAAGYTPSEAVRVVVSSDRAIEPVALVLRDATRWSGTVLDPERAPLPGATVMIVSGGLLREPPESSAMAATRTAHDGTFALEGADALGETLVAVAQGYAPASVRAAAVAERTGIELVVRPEARLLARLPRSLPGDAMLIVTDTSGVTRGIPVRSRQEILVDALAPGDTEVALRTGQRRAVRLIAGQTTQVDLTAGARVVGHVRQRGRPQARAVVTLAAVESGSISTGSGVITGADGGFTLDGISPGDYLLVAVAPRGRAERWIVVPADGEIEVDLDAAEHVVRVAVRSTVDGSPVPGARLTVAPRGGSCTAFAEATEVEDGQGWNVSVSNGGCARAASGTDGSASLVTAGSGPHVVSVEATGFARWTGEVDVVDGVTELLADLKRGGPPLVRVSIETDPPGVAGSIYCVQGGRSTSHGPLSGEATCEGFTRGPAEVAFRSPEFGVGRAAVDVPEAGEVGVGLRVRRGGGLIVPLGDRTGTNIQVVDDQGVVWNRPYGLGWPRCGLESAEASGRSYVCHELPPGTYTVVVDGAHRGAVLIRGGEVAVAH